jgi:hypothetical protein
MLSRFVLLMTLFTGLLLTPVSLQASDVEDLKAAFNRWVTAYNSRSVEDLVACYHDQAVSFGQFKEPPLSRKPRFARARRVSTTKWSTSTLARRTPSFA